jgi:hypothetical protein
MLLASKCLGPSEGFGFLRSESTLTEERRSSPSKSSKSVGLSEKKATSDADINALHINRTNMSAVAK